MRGFGSFVVGAIIVVVTVVVIAFLLFKYGGSLLRQRSDIFISYSNVANPRNAILCAIERAKSGCNDPLIDTIRWKSYDENGSLVEVSCIEFCNREQFFDKNGRVFGFESIYYPVEISVDSSSSIEKYKDPKIECLSLIAKFKTPSCPLGCAGTYVFVDDYAISKYPDVSKECNGIESYSSLALKKTTLYIYAVKKDDNNPLTLNNFIYIFIYSTPTYPVLHPNDKVSITLSKPYDDGTYVVKAVRIKTITSDSQRDLIITTRNINREEEKIEILILDFDNLNSICQEIISRGSTYKCYIDDNNYLEIVPTEFSQSSRPKTNNTKVTIKFKTPTSGGEAGRMVSSCAPRPHCLYPE